MPTITQEGSKFISVNKYHACVSVLSNLGLGITYDQSEYVAVAELLKYVSFLSHQMLSSENILDIFPDQTSACLL